MRVAAIAVPVVELPGRTPRYVAGTADRSAGIWRYRQCLSVARALTLGEGSTPLVPLERAAAAAGGGKLLAKVESANPSGSFKDRGSALVAAAALERRAQRLAIASTGNAGASMAAYAARAGIPLKVIAPTSIDPGKLWQITAHGAEIELCDGDFAACGDRYRELVAAGAFPAGSDNPLRQEGTKTLAYEIFEETGGRIDRVLAPVGTGGLIASLYMGFADIGATIPSFRIPAIDAVQLEDLRPLESHDPARLAVRTAAGGINIPNPLLRDDVLRAVERTGGLVHNVSEEELLAAQHLLATREGLGAEPTGSVTTAAYIKARQLGHIGPEEKVVAIVTGHILKAPVQILDRRNGARP